MLEKLDDVMKTLAQIERWEAEFLDLAGKLPVSTWDTEQMNLIIRHLKNKAKREARKSLAQKLGSGGQ
jgi:hypothetical protein